MKTVETLKKIVGNNNIAKLEKIKDGFVFYTIDTVSELYELRIPLFDDSDNGLQLSASVGSGELYPEIKAVTLMRFVRQSQKDGTLNRLKVY